MQNFMVLALLYGVAAGCSQASPPAEESSGKVETSGKIDVPIAEVPAEVMAAAQASRPGFVAAEAEAETRDGRRYYDIGGKLPDGTEVEFDIMEENGRWAVVETQRDVALASAPEPVRSAAAAHDAKFVPTRVIESVQNDGVTIYELYGAANGNPQGKKVEIKLDGGKAEVLTKEWAH